MIYTKLRLYGILTMDVNSYTIGKVISYIVDFSNKKTLLEIDFLIELCSLDYFGVALVFLCNYSKLV